MLTCLFNFATMISFDDTIIAEATPSGTGAISVIRLSGKDAIVIADKFFVGSKKLSEVNSHTIHYGKIISQEGETIDDVLASVFIAPNSYTGENSVEISTHGNQFIIKKIVELFIKNNARIAEPGEFTKRAFLNGRLDLAQAESVIDVINSRTDASLRGARNQLDGMLSAKVTQLRSMLINTSSLIELELDFAEEDLEFVDHTELLKRINEITNEIDILLDSYSFGKVIRDGINVAFVGKPNVGKSSLLNYILKEARAIVSEFPGTTRDIIREEVSIDGILYHLHDTAGIRETEDFVEKEGVNRSRNAVTSSDLIIFLNDATEGIDKNTFNGLLELVPREKVIVTINKTDLKEQNLKDVDVYISAKTGFGIRNLFSAMKEKSIGSHTYTEKSAIVSNIRHYNSLQFAKEHLEKAKDSAERGLTGEYLSVDLRNAESSLGEIIGEVTTDDILNNIFANFCIGK